MRQYSRYVWWLRAPGWYWGGRGLCRGLPRQGPTLVSCLPQLCLTLYFLSPAVAGLYWVICTIVLHCCLPQGVGLLTPAANWCLHARTSETERERESEWQLSNCLSQNWVVLPPEWRQTTKIKFVSLYGRQWGSILNERVCCLQQTATRGTEKAE